MTKSIRLLIVLAATVSLLRPSGAQASAISFAFQQDADGVIIYDGTGDVQTEANATCGPPHDCITTLFNLNHAAALVGLLNFDPSGPSVAPNMFVTIALTKPGATALGLTCGQSFNPSATNVQCEDPTSNMTNNPDLAGYFDLAYSNFSKPGDPFGNVDFDVVELPMSLQGSFNPGDTALTYKVNTSANDVNSFLTALQQNPAYLQGGVFRPGLLVHLNSSSSSQLASVSILTASLVDPTDASAVPEPATLALVASGLLTAVASRRRKL
jgi:hypothetical protein